MCPKTRQKRPKNQDAITDPQLHAPRKGDSREESTGAFIVPREENAEFTFFLGALSARTRGNTKPERITINSDERAYLEVVRAGILSVTDIEEMTARTKLPSEEDWLPITPKGDKFRVSGSLIDLRSHWNNITADNTRMAAEHVGTELEEQAFLLGYLGNIIRDDKKLAPEAEVKDRRFEFTMSNAPELVTDLARILFRRGIFCNPSIKQKGLSKITIDDDNDINTLLAFLRNSPPQMVQESLLQLVEKLANVRQDRRNYTPMEYDAAMEEITAEERKVEEHGGRIHVSDIVSRLKEREPPVDLPAHKITQWKAMKPDGQTRNAVPTSVKRRAKLRELEESCPSNRTICTLFRRGLDSEQTRQEAQTLFEQGREDTLEELDGASLIQETDEECGADSITQQPDTIPGGVTSDGSEGHSSPHAKEDTDPSPPEPSPETQVAVKAPNSNHQNSVVPAHQDKHEPERSSLSFEDEFNQTIKPIFDRCNTTAQQPVIHQAMISLWNRGMTFEIIRMGRALAKVTVPKTQSKLLVQACTRINKLERSSPATGDPQKDFDTPYTRGVNKMVNALESGDHDSIFYD